MPVQGPLTAAGRRSPLGDLPAAPRPPTIPDPMATPIDTGTILSLLRRATETVRNSTARAAAAEARADRLGREVGALLGRVEEALRTASAETAEAHQAAAAAHQDAEEARRAAAKAQARAGAAEARLSAERARIRRLEERLAEVMADIDAARDAATAAEAGREAAERRLTRIRAALIDDAALPPEAERPAALH